MSPSPPPRQNRSEVSQRDASRLRASRCSTQTPAPILDAASIREIACIVRGSRATTVVVAADRQRSEEGQRAGEELAG